MIKTVPERLRDAAKLFEERNATYGGNYRHFGRVMAALFPSGLGAGDHTEKELGRLLLVCHLVTKLTRYCNSLRSGGHADSLEDLAVYALMTAELDEEARVAAASLVKSGADRGDESVVTSIPIYGSGYVGRHLVDDPQSIPLRGGEDDRPMSDPPEAGINDEWRRDLNRIVNIGVTYNSLENPGKL